MVRLAVDWRAKEVDDDALALYREHMQKAGSSRGKGQGHFCEGKDPRCERCDLEQTHSLILLF